MPSPNPAARSRPLRCAYREDGRACRRNGSGNPPLCSAHRLVLEQAQRQPGAGIRDVVDRLRAGQRVTGDDLVGAAAEVIFGMFGAQRAPDLEAVRAAAAERIRQARARAAAMRGGADPGPQPTPTPAKLDPNGADPKVASARRTLGFDNVYLHLTADDVKAKRRELARRYHPDFSKDDRDRAYRNQQMTAINAAADLLLEGFG